MAAPRNQALVTRRLRCRLAFALLVIACIALSCASKYAHVYGHAARGLTSGAEDRGSWWNTWSHYPPSRLSQAHGLLDEAERRDLIGGIDTILSRYSIDWPVDPWRSGREITIAELEDLRNCLVARSCASNRSKIVIGASFHFGNSQNGDTSGEDIWARSSVDSFRELGYTLLFAYKPLEVLALHQAIGRWIRIIIMDAVDVKDCTNAQISRTLSMGEASNPKKYHVEEEVESTPSERERADTPDAADLAHHGWMKLQGPGGESAPRVSSSCIKREGFEEGIPLWKIFSFHFWDGPSHPLGRDWTVSPENYGKGNFYLGYSIERYCDQGSYVEMADKLDRAFVYGKTANYFTRGQSAFYRDNHTFLDIALDIGIEFVAAVGDPRKVVLPDTGLTNIGRQTAEDFNSIIAHSKVLIGVGHPAISPTPYYSLCMGVPFINPMIGWNDKEPNRRESWWTQHDGLRFTEEPFVYHVKKHDYASLKHAVERARQSSIRPYIPAAMTIAANAARHQNLVERDWAGHFRQHLLGIAESDATLRTILV